jgi:hypothetical protein
MIAFCRYWRMSPREVDTLTGEEYEAMTRYALAEERRAKREATKAKSRARR